MGSNTKPVAVLVSAFIAPWAMALDATAVVTLEQDYFLETTRQNDWQYNASLLGAVEVSHEPSRNDRLVLGASGRLDGRDEASSRLSLEQAYWQRWLSGGLSARLGYMTYFWGVMEGNNPVNILNQSRLTEGLAGEVKMSQPTLNVTHDSGALLVNGYLMTNLQGRPFPGKQGRPALPLPVATGDARYATEPGYSQWDAALRAQWLLGNLDLALSYFSGLSREPGFDLRISDSEAQQLMTSGDLPDDHNVALVPRYEMLEQAGIESLYFIGNMQLKGELVYRSTPNEQYWRGATGLEYGLYGLGGTRIDATLYAEYLFDTQSSAIDPLFGNDLFLGARVDINDVRSSFVEVGVIADLKTPERLLDITMETRLIDRVTLSLGGQGYLSKGEVYTDDTFAQTLVAGDRIKTPLALYQQESYLTMSLSYYW